MMSARGSRAAKNAARGVLALLGALGPIACQRSGQGRAPETQSASPGPGWSGEEQARPLTDADVELLAKRVPRERVPRVSDKNPSKGPADAPVTLQVFSDFECPFCVDAAPALDSVEQRYHGRIRLVWRNYPLPSHPRARPAARAALAAFAIGGSSTFWGYHDVLYSAEGDLSDAGLARAAKRLSLDPAAIEQASKSSQYDAAIDADVKAGNDAGIEGTPAAFINDYYTVGALSDAQYALIVERALREARQ